MTWLRRAVGDEMAEEGGNEMILLSGKVSLDARGVCRLVFW